MQKENRTPQPVRWGEKRFYSLDYYLKQTYGHKLYKIALDAGMTCPTRDGTLGTRGCIFCSRGGSGDFAENSLSPSSLFRVKKSSGTNSTQMDTLLIFRHLRTPTLLSNDCARFLPKQSMRRM